MSYEREVEVVDLSQGEEVTVNMTTVTTTATRSVTREVVSTAPADSGLRRREVGRSSATATTTRGVSPSDEAGFLPCEYYGRDAGAGVLPFESEEDAELERRQARDLLRAIENRKGQQQQASSSFYDSEKDQQGYSTARSSYEDEEDDEVEGYGREEEERREEEEEEEEEEDREGEEEENRDEGHGEGKKKLAAMKKKGEQYVKRVAKEVEDAGRRGASRMKHRAAATAKRASLLRPSSTAGLIFRLALGAVLTALMCMFVYEYFLSWGPSRPVHFGDGTWRELPPGSKAGSWGIPYVGESIDYFRDPFKFTLRHARKYGPISYSDVLGEHTVILSGSKALGQVFYNTTLVQRRGALPANVAALLGRDILPAIDNSRHAEVRAIIMQAINTRGVIQAHLNTLDRVMNKHMAGWTRQFTPFDMLKDIKAMTASMASTLFFSNDESLYLAPLLDQVLAALAACPSPLTGSTYLQGLFAKDQLMTWYESAIEDHLREIEANSNKYNGDVLDLMLKLSHKIPDITPKHLAHELHYLVLSTYEMYNPISAVVVAMEQYPDWLPLLREEVQAMNFDPTYPALPFDKLHRIDLLSLFINETRRFYPSAVAEWGKARLTFEHGGFIIPEGFRVMAAVAATHLDANDHKQPESFDPTRFADEGDNEYSYVPHGGGPRDSSASHRCVGEDLSFYTVKLFLMNLLARHDWRLEAGQNVNFDTAHYLPEPHSLRVSSFSNATSGVSYSTPSSSLPVEHHISPDHITIAVA